MLDLHIDVLADYQGSTYSPDDIMNVAPYVMTGRPRPMSDPMAWLRSKPGYWVAKSALDRGDYEARPAEIQARDKLACQFLVERGKLI